VRTPTILALLLLPLTAACSGKAPATFDCSDAWRTPVQFFAADQILRGTYCGTLLAQQGTIRTF